MQAINWVIFDKGGVLTAGSFDEMARGFHDTFGLLGTEVHSLFLEHFRELETGRMTEEEFLEEAARETRGVARQPSIRHFLETFSRGEERIESSWAMVEALKANGVRVGLLSNTIPSHAELNRAQGMYDPFDPVMLSCEMGYRKPQQTVWRMLTTMCGAEPGEMLLIDDNQENVDSARGFGIDAVRYEDGASLRRALEIRSLL